MNYTAQRYQQNNSTGLMDKQRKTMDALRTQGYADDHIRFSHEINGQPYQNYVNGGFLPNHQTINIDRPQIKERPPQTGLLEMEEKQSQDLELKNGSGTIENYKLEEIKEAPGEQLPMSGKHSPPNGQS